MSHFVWGTLVSQAPCIVHIDGDPPGVTVPAVFYGDIRGLTARVRLEIRRRPLEPLIVPYALVNPTS